MTNLQQRQKKIQEKRKTTPFRDFVKEIVSWFPIVFHKNQGHMSRYPETDRVGVVSSNQDFSAIRDSMKEYGVEYDPQQSIFDQIHDLMKSIPLGATIRQMAGENTDYADSVVGSSHAYLSSAIINDCRDILYSFVVFDYCKTVIDSLRVGSYSENIYSSVGVIKSTNVLYSRYITNSSNIWFSANLIGCHDCVGCIDLENKSYCIRNEQYTKEEYKTKKQQLLAQKQGFEHIIDALPIESNNFGSTDVSGNHVTMSTEVEQGYFVNRLEKGRNVICVGGENQEKNFYDMFDAGVNSYDMYANEGSGVYSNNIYCSTQVERSSTIFYSYYLVNCSYCFGCMGLQNKQYCILNKQYTKEEWEQKVDEIFIQMEKNGTLGEFFPGSMNPFYFNDTAASLIEDFSKEEVEADGYLRRDEEIAVDIPEWMDVVEVKDLGDYEERKTPHLTSPQGEEDASSSEDGKEWWIDPAILKKVIRDEEGNVYRVIKMEYDFLMKHGLPLPRKHRLERLKGHFRVK